MDSFFSHFLSDTPEPYASVLSEYRWLFSAVGDMDRVIAALLPYITGYREIERGVWVHPSARIASTALIEGPAIIGEGCEIRHGAYLRGEVVLGKGCTVGNSTELKSSLILDNCQLPHYNYVGNSILSQNCHLGAGAVISNLRSDKGNVTLHIDGRAYPTGMRKLGAILASGVEVGCGAVICPGSVIGKRATVYPLALVRGYLPAHTLLKNDGTQVPLGGD
jgi:NDP-sugar pyrophosphorylase family protein